MCGSLIVCVTHRTVSPAVTVAEAGNISATSTNGVTVPATNVTVCVPSLWLHLRRSDRRLGPQARRPCHCRTYTAAATATPEGVLAGGHHAHHGERSGHTRVDQAHDIDLECRRERSPSRRSVRCPWSGWRPSSDPRGTVVHARLRGAPARTGHAAADRRERRCRDRRIDLQLLRTILGIRRRQHVRSPRMPGRLTRLNKVAVCNPSGVVAQPKSITSPVWILTAEQGRNRRTRNCGRPEANDPPRSRSSEKPPEPRHSTGNDERAHDQPEARQQGDTTTTSTITTSLPLKCPLSTGQLQRRTAGP